jgi:hypothetical protein
VLHKTCNDGVRLSLICLGVITQQQHRPKMILQTLHDQDETAACDPWPDMYLCIMHCTT